MSSSQNDDYGNGEFQFSAEFNYLGAGGGAPRDFMAYLWIPPSCSRIRAAIVTQQNVGEQVFIEHPGVRRVCAKNDVAIVWCCPPIDLKFEFNRELAVHLQEEVLRKLGNLSGYDELGKAPWITFGHSNTTTFARILAETRPERTIAILSAKGEIMLPEGENITIPGVYSGGQYPEWRQHTHDWNVHGMSLPGLKKIRETLAERPRPVSYVEEYGGGHSEPYLQFLSLYIDKAIQYRLLPDGSLRSIKKDEGYVVDLQVPLPSPPFTVLPLAEATDDLRHAPWFFDKEIADAAAHLMDSGSWKRKNQLVAFANLDGTPATFSKSGIADPVPMEMAADGITVQRMETTFLNQLPDNFVQAGMKLTHATGGGRTIERVSGVFSVEDGKYRIRLNRGYPETPNFIAVRHQGDAVHRPSVQPGRFVPPTYAGRAQTIIFAEITNQHVGTRSLPLKAFSSAGLTVEYFVRSGPAKVVGDQLILLPLPPRTRFPVRITVAAWQFGRGSADPISAAPIVEQSFYINSL
jgi:hypothetical protein